MTSPASSSSLPRAPIRVISGTIYPSSGPIAGGYYMAIHLDKQEPWPPNFHNGQRVFVSTHPEETQ